MFSPLPEEQNTLNLSQIDGESLYLKLINGREHIWPADSCLELRNKVSADLQSLYQSGAPQIQASGNPISVMSIRELTGDIGSEYKFSCHFFDDQPALCGVVLTKIHNVKIIRDVGGIVEFESRVFEQVQKRREKSDEQGIDSALDSEKSSVEDEALRICDAHASVSRRHFGQELIVDWNRSNLQATLLYRFCKPIEETFESEDAVLFPRSPEPWQLEAGDWQPEILLLLDWEDYHYCLDISTGKASLARGNRAASLEGSEVAVDHQILNYLSRDLLPWAEGMIP